MIHDLSSSELRQRLTRKVTRAHPDRTESQIAEYVQWLVDNRDIAPELIEGWIE